LPDLCEEVCNLLMPEVILCRAQEGTLKRQQEISKTLKTLEENGYQLIDINYMEQQEIIRKTALGLELLEFSKKNEKLPDQKIIEIIRKFAYSVTNYKKISLTGFPQTIENLMNLEKECVRINKEFYIGQQGEISLGEHNLETHMQSKGKLVFIENFNPDLLNTYIGNQLNYALIIGSLSSGKTTTAKKLEKMGFILLDLDVLTEEIKKRLATPENPIENITVSFDQKLEELKNIMLKRKNKDDRFVLDNLPIEDAELMKKILNAIGVPTNYIVLETDIKEIKKRYQKKAELPELNEEETQKIDKRIDLLKKSKIIIYKICEHPASAKYTINTDQNEEFLTSKLKSIYQPNIILLKHEKSLEIDSIFTNLSIKYNFLYISLDEIIKNEIIRKTALGKELNRTKVCKEITEDFASNENIEFCAIHYDQKLILKILKDILSKSSGKYQIAIINGYLNSHKLKGYEEKQDFRAMDELFAIEKEIGQIKGVINLTKSICEDIENDRIPQEISVPTAKNQAKSEVKKDENAEASPEKSIFIGFHKEK